MTRLLRTSILCALAGAWLSGHNALAQDEPLTPEGGPVLNSLGDSQADLVYTPLTPCRIVDTRLAGGVMAPGTTRSFRVTGTNFSAQGGSAGDCGVPVGPATAAMINFVAVDPAGLGNLRVAPFGTAIPVASIINYAAGLTIANGLVVAICNPAASTCASDFTLQANASAVQVVADVLGYFKKTSGVRADHALRNTVLGDGALPSNTTGDNNTATGDQALGSNTTGSYNNAMGSNALAANSTGTSNTATGAYALWFNTTGSYNTASGAQALLGNTGGGSNTGTGANALYHNTTGYYNSALGQGSLASNTTGSYNIAVGMAAGYLATTGDHNIYIGHIGVGAEGNTTRIGTAADQIRFFAAGIRGVTTGANDAIPVLIDSAGQLGTISSSIRFKEDVRDMADASDALLQLRPVTFRYKGRPETREERHYGLVAEEVSEVVPELVAHSADGEIETVKYHELPAMLLNELQKQQRRLQAQDERLCTQAEKLTSQDAEIDDLRARLARLEGR
jgi:hypothetical protein